MIKNVGNSFSFLGQDGAVQHNYVALVQQGKIGWFFFAALIGASAAAAYNNSLLVPIALLIPLFSLLLVRRDLLAAALGGRRAAAPTLPLIAVGVSAIAASLAVILDAEHSVVLQWWMVPIASASAVVILNVWLQTRGDQLSNGFGFLLALIVGASLLKAFDAGFIHYVLLCTPLAATAWFRKTTGSVLWAFVIYLSAGEAGFVTFLVASIHR